MWQELGSSVLGQVYLDSGSGPEDSVLVAGSGRSGTTWVAGIVNYRNDYRYIHEPFRPHRLKTARVFRPRHYIRPNERDPQLIGAADAILSGRIRSMWTDKYNRKRLPGKRLIKEVRGNLLLPWLQQNFPQTPVVLLLRHPCAVVASQLRLASDWRVDLGRFLQEDELMEDHLSPFRDALQGARTPFEKHLIVWCIENLVPLRHLSPAGTHVGLYEWFVTDPETEIERLFRFLGADFDPRVLDTIGRPSPVTERGSEGAGRRRLDGWRDVVSEAELRWAADLLGLFGLDHLYGDDTMPRLRDGTATLAAPGGYRAGPPES
jgi:hypothetical protein